MMTAKQRQILGALKIEARRAQASTKTLGKTGVWVFGPVSVRYYPVCGRFTFFLYGYPTSQRSLLTWMTTP